MASKRQQYLASFAPGQRVEISFGGHEWFPAKVTRKTTRVHVVTPSGDHYAIDPSPKRIRPAASIAGRGAGDQLIVDDLVTVQAAAPEIAGEALPPPPWSGLCPAGKHGLDWPGQACDLCPRERLAGADRPRKPLAELAAEVVDYQVTARLRSLIEAHRSLEAPERSQARLHLALFHPIPELVRFAAARGAEWRQLGDDPELGVLTLEWGGASWDLHRVRNPLPGVTP